MCVCSTLVLCRVQGLADFIQRDLPRPHTPRIHENVSVSVLKVCHLQGVGACWARDIPFSMIYFPTYSFTKKYLESKGYNEFGCALIAGLVAGVIGAARKSCSSYALVLAFFVHWVCYSDLSVSWWLVLRISRRRLTFVWRERLHLGTWRGILIIVE